MNIRSLLALFLVLAMSPLATAAVESPPAAVKPPPGVEMAAAVSATTGIAISPLFGMGAVGAWQWWHTPEAARAGSPWHAHPGFWIPALLLVALLVLKEPMLYFFPGAKKPLDLVEVIENKASALVAAPLVLHLAIQTFRHASSAGASTPIVSAGVDPGTSVMVVIGSLGLLAVFACVWMVSHAVNMLILLSPSATLDMAMRGFRGLVLSAVALSAMLNPWFGLVIALVVILVCYRCFGWAWRLMIFGSTIAFDLVTRRKQAGTDGSGKVRAFLARADAATRLPRRSRGWLHLDATGELVFTGRALPWRPAASIAYDARAVQITRGLLGPDLRDNSPGGFGSRALASLPPRFTGAEESLGKEFGIDASTQHPAARTWQAAVRWLTDTLGQNIQVKSLDG